MPKCMMRSKCSRCSTFSACGMAQHHYKFEKVCPLEVAHACASVDARAVLGVSWVVLDAA